jgi:hypothetical protein
MRSANARWWRLACIVEDMSKLRMFCVFLLRTACVAMISVQRSPRVVDKKRPASRGKKSMRLTDREARLELGFEGGFEIY